MYPEVSANTCNYDKKPVPHETRFSYHPQLPSKFADFQNTVTRKQFMFSLISVNSYKYNNNLINYAERREDFFEEPNEIES